MRKKHELMALAILLLAVTGSIVWAAEERVKSPSALEGYFQKAKHDYLQKDLNAAAKEIRKAAAFMKSEAEKGGAIGKEALTESYQNLEKLADEVKKGAVTTVGTLETAFARSYHALAANSAGKSTEAFTKKEVKKAGEHLDAAVKYLEQGLGWTGRQIQTGTAEVIKKSKDLSRKLKKGSKSAADEVAKGLKDMEQEIGKIGKGSTAN